MKKLKMILMATATFIGLGAVFAFSPSKQATTYYAIKNGSSFVWSETSSGRCLPTVQNVACTIVTSTPPTNGVFPSGHTVTNRVYR
jgi:hypothetical protein